MKVVSSIKSWFSQLDTKKINNPKHLLIGAVAIGGLAYLAKCGYDSYKVACLLKECNQVLDDPVQLKAKLKEIATKNYLNGYSRASFANALVQSIDQTSKKDLLKLIDQLLNEEDSGISKCFCLSILEALCKSKCLEAITTLSQLHLKTNYSRWDRNQKITQHYKILDYFSVALEEEKSKGQANTEEYIDATNAFGKVCLENVHDSDFQLYAEKALCFLNPIYFRGSNFESKLIYNKLRECLLKRSILNLAESEGVKQAYMELADYANHCGAAADSRLCPTADIIAEASYRYFLMMNPGINNNNTARKEIVVKEYLERAAEREHELALLLKKRLAI